MNTPVTLSDKRYMTSISRMPISTVRFTVKSETGRLLFYGELSIDLPRPARMCSNSKASIRYRPATMKNCSIAESDRVTLEPNFSKLVGHPASDKEIRINRGNHRCENALHLMFTPTTALDSTARSSRHTRLSCMLTFLENTGSHNRLLSMVQNIPVRIRCNESMCRRT